MQITDFYACHFTMASELRLSIWEGAQYPTVDCLLNYTQEGYKYQYSLYINQIKQINSEVSLQKSLFVKKNHRFEYSDSSDSIRFQKNGF